MTLQLGKLTLKNQVLLAPMAGVTDAVFRSIARKQGAALVYTEMININALLSGKDRTLEMLRMPGDEGPFAVQLIGHDPEKMARAAEHVVEQTVRINGRPCDLIDINMGCPTPRIIKNGDGSAVMKNPELAGKLVRAVVNAVSVPVTVKMRKGFLLAERTAPEIAWRAEDNGASAVTVHGRTGEQFYKGRADWSIIAEVKNQLAIPVVGNGDIFAPEDARQMIAETGCDAVMLARGTLGNPWLISRTVSLLAGGVPENKPVTKERIAMAINHLEMMVAERGEKRGLIEMRKHLGWYTKGLPGAAHARRELMREENKERVITILTGLASALQDG